MRIVYVVPGLMDPNEVARRGNLLQEWAFEGTKADIVCVPEGPASIESMYEEYLSIPATAKLMVDLEKKGYDAAILGCAGDPGLDAMRELTTSMTVIGPGQTGMHAAAMMGHRFSLVTIADSMIQSSYDMAYKAGVLQKLASVVSVNIPVLELMDNIEHSLQKIIAVCKTAIENDRTDAFVLGCMTMGFLNVAEDIEKAVGVPVVNPAKACLKFAEAVVGCGLGHSKKAFASPPKLSSGKVASIDDLYIKGK